MSELLHLVRLVRTVLARTIESDRRIAATEFRGRVAEVSGEKHAVRLVIGQTPEGEDVLSPWVPVSQTAGAMKVHDLPSVGQQGSISTANGDIQQGRFSAFHWSEGFEAISDAPDAKIMKLGDLTVSWSGSGLRAEVGDTVFELTTNGILLNGQSVAVTGAAHTHNGQNIGDTHVHGGIFPGGADTDTPH